MKIFHIRFSNNQGYPFKKYRYLNKSFKLLWMTFSFFILDWVNFYLFSNFNFWTRLTRYSNQFFNQFLSRWKKTPHNLSNNPNLVHGHYPWYFQSDHGQGAWLEFQKSRSASDVCREECTILIDHNHMDCVLLCQSLSLIQPKLHRITQSPQQRALPVTQK